MNLFGRQDDSLGGNYIAVPLTSLNQNKTFLNTMQAYVE